MKFKEKPKIIEGGLSVDDRGVLSFSNDFNFEDVKRFYLVENFSTDTVRAFHGHLKEEKYCLVTSGSAIIALVEMDDIKKPNKKNEIYRFILSTKKPNLIHFPAGYANGFRALEPNTKIMFFSTSSLSESSKDDYRFPANYWGDNIWEVTNR